MDDDLKFVLRYQCLFGLLHVKTGTWLICFATIFVSFLLMVLNPTYISYFLSPGITFSFFAMGPLIGIYTVKSWLFIPYLLISGSTVALVFLGNIYSVFVFLLTPSHELTTMESYNILILPFIFGFGFWAFYIVYCCYDYIHEKQYLFMLEKQTPVMV